MISLLVVNYRSARLAIEAIRSARASASSPIEIVVVDNSVDSAEADLLRPHADVLIVSQANIGYAAAINRGREKCQGSVVIVSNPDVIFRHGAIGHLAAALQDESVAVAGPALYWDDGDEWILPPSDLQTAMEKLDEALASRMRVWFEWRDRRRIRRRLRFWRLNDPTPAKAISGAVMAISTRAFDALGGFDERFRLYFEENDFLRRVRASGKRILYLPQARCRHLYNQSAGQSHEAAELYAASERTYLEKWYGSLVAGILIRLARPVRLPDPTLLEGSIDIVDPDSIVEASPLRTFVTAAGHFPKSGSVDVPDEVWRSYRGAVLYLRVVRSASARVVATRARHKRLE